VRVVTGREVKVYRFVVPIDEMASIWIVAMNAFPGVFIDAIFIGPLVISMLTLSRSKLGSSPGRSTSCDVQGDLGYQLCVRWV
jgi:hypothetical protein